MSWAMKAKKKTTRPGKSAPAGKVFDVVRPGKAIASATSRPVIVGLKPQVQDPMMSSQSVLMDAAQKQSTDPSQETTPVGSQLQETPVEPAQNPQTPEQVKPPEPAVPASAPEIDQAVSEVSSSDTKAAQEVTTAVLDNTVKESEPENIQPISPEPVSSFPSDLEVSEPVAEHEEPKQEGKQEPLPVLPEEPAPKLILSQRPKIKIGAIVSWIIFILLIVIIFLDFLLDIGFVHWAIPHTHFFSSAM